MNPKNNRFGNGFASGQAQGWSPISSLCLLTGGKTWGQRSKRASNWQNLDLSKCTSEYSSNMCLLCHGYWPRSRGAGSSQSDSLSPGFSTFDHIRMTWALGNKRRLRPHLLCTSQGFPHILKETLKCFIWRMSSVPLAVPECECNFPVMRAWLFAPTRAPPSPHLSPRDTVEMKSLRASFAQHDKSGKYQSSWVDYVFPTPHQFLFFRLSNIIAPSCSIYRQTNGGPRLRLRQ